MDNGEWDSTVFECPNGAVPTPTRKCGLLKLPRGYDSTRLFNPAVRGNIEAHQHALKLRGMELGLSSPDMVGIRIPDSMPSAYAPFINPLPNLGETSRTLLENMYHKIEGTLDERSFLFAIAVKRTTRSDRLYQPLFEANVLKYLVEVVLRGAFFKFHVHLGSFEGSDVEGRYNAASLISLMRGGEPSKAVDSLYRVQGPVDAAQTILNDMPSFPL